MSGIVILGTGECGVRAAFAARDFGFEGPITLIGEEAGLPYERPPLSKPEADRAILKPICTTLALAEKDIRLLDGVKATNIDRRAQTVALSSGKSIGYDLLLFATGPSPRSLRCEGADRALTFRTLADANRIYAAADLAREVIIIGAGLIGLELAAELSGRGVAVIVLENSPVPLSRTVPQALARRIVDRHLAEGVQILTGVEVVRVTGRTVELADGRSIPGAVVVAAVGVTPNTELADAAGLATGNGIRVDEHLRTADPAIFAAGDCASVQVEAGGHQRFETWQNAQAQGEIAGRNIAGADVTFAPPVCFWSDQFDLGLQGVGTTQGDPSAIRPLGEGAELLFYLDGGDRLVGAAGLGQRQEVAKDIKLSQKLIEAGIPVSATQLSDPAINLKKLLRATAVA